MNKIIINRGSFRVDEVEFEQGTTTIGRANDNTISIDDSAVSSHHAKIVTIFHTSYIEDLDSTNGTLVNGKTVQKHTLHSGDVIAVGNHQLLFQCDKSPQQNSEVSETVLLRGNEVKQRLSEFIQAQTELEKQRGAVNPPVGPQKTAEDSNIRPDNQQKPELDANHNLVREQNKAWIDAKTKSVLAEKIPTKTNANTTPTKSTDIKQPALKKIGNTAAAINKMETKSAEESANLATDILVKTVSNSTPINADTEQSENPAAEPESTPLSERDTIDIAAAARAATQRYRRSNDPDYAPNGTIALNRGKPRGKVMAMVWLLIVAILIAEVVYITYRYMG